MHFTIKEKEYLLEMFSEEEVAEIGKAVDNCDIVIRSVGKNGVQRLIKPSRARFHVGYKKFCDGIATAHLKGSSRQHNYNTGKTLIFRSLLPK
jgi:hypothetical protein